MYRVAHGLMFMTRLAVYRPPASLAAPAVTAPALGDHLQDRATAPYFAAVARAGRRPWSRRTGNHRRMPPTATVVSRSHRWVGNLWPSPAYRRSRPRLDTPLPLEFPNSCKGLAAACHTALVLSSPNPRHHPEHRRLGEHRPGLVRPATLCHDRARSHHYLGDVR